MTRLTDADVEKGIFLHHHKTGEFLLVWRGRGATLLTDLKIDKTDEIDFDASRFVNYDVVPHENVRWTLDQLKAELERRVRMARDQLHAAETDLRALEGSSAVANSILRR